MGLEKLTKNVPLSALETVILQDLIALIESGQKLGIREVATRNYTSTTTIIRLAKKLGYRGFTDLYYGLQRQLRHGSDDAVAEDVPFLDGFCAQLQELRCQYEPIRRLAQTLHLQKRMMVYICGMGFSSFPADYFSKKLMVQGIKCIFSGAEETVAIFESNLEDIGLFIAVSRSGETAKVLERVRLARQQQIPIAAFTAQPDSTLARLSDIVLVMGDNEQLDDKNINPCYFFAGILLQMELVIRELQAAPSSDAP